jgi:hypothetical protein
MRGQATRQKLMLLGVTANDLIPADHPIRRIKPIVDHALTQLGPTFAQMYAADRPHVRFRSSHGLTRRWVSTW